ncbi:MAG: N-succinyldiaminopimelate aminotransferase [Frankiales bacterium]|nr:N-succinyldiaminopimelate aminotransferase [Frankiales bacterium]MDX6273807.1 N-succinyldiaminopimelate aminotransferase [Frankiales bacterium]
MQGYGTTIFAAITALAAEHDAVNLGQGFPDSDGPPGMLAVAAQALTGGGRNQYPPGPGIPELRAAVAAQRARDYGQELDPNGEVLVTVGATEAISAAVLALAEPGDEVLVLDPCYDSYAAAISLAGAVRVSVPLRPDADGRFALDSDELRAAVTPRTRVLLLNSPHNPTGTVLTTAELEAVAAIANDRDLTVVTDEVYEHLVYDGVRHQPLALLDGMPERTLSVSSAGKTFSVTGWKVGWACGPRELVSAVTTVKQFLTFTANNALQLAVAHALDHEMDWVAGLRESLQQRRDQLVSGLTESGFVAHRPQGTYFVQADVSALGQDARELALTLPASHGVAAIPTAVFAADPAPWTGYLRFAFCKQPAVLAEAVTRLTRAPLPG